jgi:hypothetical protein
MKKLNIDPNEIDDLFFNKKHSVKTIALILKCSKEYIYSYLRRINGFFKRYLKEAEAGRKCTHCNCIFPAENFPVSSIVKGKIYKRSICISCFKRYLSLRKKITKE